MIILFRADFFEFQLTGFLPSDFTLGGQTTLSTPAAMTQNVQTLFFNCNRMARISISVAQKLAILQDKDDRLAVGESLKSVARSHGVSPSQIRRWEKQRQTLKSCKPAARSTSKGRPSSIRHLEEQVIAWGLDMHSTGVKINYRQLQLKACAADPEFAAKPQHVQYQQIRRLCHQNKLAQHRKTQVSQDTPQEAQDDAREWLLSIRPLLAAPNVQKAYVLNMSQTTVPFSLGSGQTLELRGATTVTVKSTGNKKTRCTVSLTIAADGSKLKPMIIFKGQPHGRVATTELTRSPYRNRAFLCCQESAWQDSDNLIQWVDAVLVPHLQAKAAGAPAFLFLDDSKCPQSPHFIAKLAAMGIHLERIPNKYTTLVQPCDVGVTKPLKERVRRLWWDGLIELAEADAVISAPSRDQIAEWVMESWDSLPANFVQNSWLHHDYKWFL